MSFTAVSAHTSVYTSIQTEETHFLWFSSGSEAWNKDRLQMDDIQKEIHTTVITLQCNQKSVRVSFLINPLLTKLLS